MLNRLYIIHTATTKSKPCSGIISGHVYVLDTIMPSNSDEKKTVYFFDSYGKFNEIKYKDVIIKIRNYASLRQSPIVFNHVRHQPRQTFLCAYLSICYALLKSRGYALLKIQSILANVKKDAYSISVLIKKLMEREFETSVLSLVGESRDQVKNLASASYQNGEDKKQKKNQKKKEAGIQRKGAAGKEKKRKAPRCDQPAKVKRQKNQSTESDGEERYFLTDHDEVKTSGNVATGEKRRVVRRAIRRDETAVNPSVVIKGFVTAFRVCDKLMDVTQP